MTLKVHFNRISFQEQYDTFVDLLDDDIEITIGDQIPENPHFEILVYPTASAEWLRASPNLRALVIPWAGVPEKTKATLADFPQISVHNLHHNNFNTAEMGFTLLLAAAKHLIPLDQSLRKNDWTPRDEPTRAILLRGRTALILGYGEIGQALADYCLGFGMNVIATKKHPQDAPEKSGVTIYPADELEACLPQANVVFVALPHTAETEGLIGKAELSLLPKDAILVNIGRGPVVDQHALYQALTEGHLRAAASDVWYNYPPTKEDRSHTPPADVPFGDLDNFVLSPHRGGMVEGVEEQRMTALADLLNAANRGEPIPNKVDLSAGY